MVLYCKYQHPLVHYVDGQDGDAVQCVEDSVVSQPADGGDDALDEGVEEGDLAGSGLDQGQDFVEADCTDDHQGYDSEADKDCHGARLHHCSLLYITM